MALDVRTTNRLSITAQKELLRKSFLTLIGCQPDDLEILDDLIDFREMDAAIIEAVCKGHISYGFSVSIGSAELEYLPFRNFGQINRNGFATDMILIGQLATEHKERKRQAEEIARLESKIAKLKRKIAKLHMSPNPGKDYIAAKGRFDTAKEQ